MRLLSLKAENLFSLGKVEIDLNKRGLVLITGYSEDEGGFNGSGKSSLANKAVLWTLWGETAGGVKADAVLNRHGKKKCYGEIEFVAVDGTTYKLHRARPAKLTLSRDGLDVTLATTKDTQELIDQLLGFNFATFLQTSFFGQGRSMHYPSLPPKDQKAVLEQILPMEEVDKWAAYADSKMRELQPREKELEHAMVRIKGKLDALQDNLIQVNKRGVEFEAQRSAEIGLLKGQIANQDEMLESDRRELNSMWARCKHVNIEECERKIESFKTVLNDCFKSLAEANEQYGKARDVNNQWENRALQINVEISSMRDKAACNTCKRPFDNQDDIKVKIAELELALARGEEPLKQAGEALAYWTQQQHVLTGVNGTATREIATLTMMIKDRNTYDREKARFEAKEQTLLGALQSKMKAAEEKVNPYVANREQLIQSVCDAETEESVTGIAFSKIKEEMDHLIHWKNFYGKEIKLKLFEDACPFLDTAAAYHLSRLKNSQIHVEFSTIKRLASGEAKEEFNVNVWSETGGQGFDSLSGGEQQMTSFAIGLALADLASRSANAKSGFMIVDEAFTELDLRNSEAVVEYLTSEVQAGKDTILLISNDEALKGLIQQRIHVIKRHGITAIEDKL